MTRKRYIKLQMAAGIPRNAAVKNAETVRKLNRSYNDCITVLNILLCLRSLDELLRGLGKALQSIVEAIAEAIEQNDTEEIH